MNARWRIRATALVVFWTLAAPLLADPIDDFIQARLQSGKIPGIALLVMKDGAIAKQQGYGFANLELRVPVTPDTIFQSGSTGKQFAAAGILLLAEAGKLNLDDRLAAYYPDAPAAWHRITIRQLLTHTSGIKDYTELESGDLDFRKDYTDDELLAVMQKLPIEFEPGTQWSYSNSGYLILGLLMTKLTGKDYSDFLAERLFKPLGMQTTRLISERDIIANRAAGYQLDEHGTVVNQDWVAPGLNRTADGALYFSIRDLAAWERALEARSFMSEQSFAAWWTAASFTNGSRYPYGFGWSLGEQRGEPVIEHSGSWQGFKVAIWRYPNQRLAVMVLTNSANANPSAIARGVAGLVDHALAARLPAAAPLKSDTELSNSLHGVLEAWGGFRTVPAMTPALAATATGSASEADDRQAVAAQLRIARSLRVLGSDRLSQPAVDLLADGSVTAVDAVLETDQAMVPVRLHLDAKRRVVSFAVDD